MFDFSTLKEHGSEYRLLIGYQWRLNVSKTYTWLYGLVMSRDKSMTTAVMNAWDCFTVAVVVLYFLFCSKKWFPLFFGIAFIAAICHVVMLWLAPESPKWLLGQGKVKEAINSLN